MEGLEIVELTREQEKKWADTRAALVWHCPAFTHILYTMLDNNNGKHIAMFIKEGTIPIAATDGSNILIVPEPFFKRTLSERIFIVVHEIMHGILGHCEMMLKFSTSGKVPYPDGKILDFDAETMNKAMDYVINDTLIQSKIGQYSPDWLHDTTIATYQDSVLTAYRRIHQTPPPSGGQGQGPGKGQSSFDKHLKPGTSTGKDPAAAAAARSDVAWKTAIAGALASARVQGKLPGALERVLSDIIEPEVDWTDKIYGFFARKPGGGTYDWKRPDRRFVTRNIITPARSGYGAGPIVVAIDTSGSVGEKEQNLFFGALFGILQDIRPTEIAVIFCDSKVHRVDFVEDDCDIMDLKHKGAPGGGGTSFRPVFEKVIELGLEPDAMVYLTDGMGAFPDKQPGYPVLWGSIEPRSKFPWGEVVDIPSVK